MDANFPQVPPPPPEHRKHSKLGIGSFISAIVALLFMGTFVGRGFGVLPLEFVHGQQNSYLNRALVSLAGLAALVGAGLGIAAVVQKGTRKMFGILGLVLILVDLCAFFLIMIMILMIVS